ncbi:MAG: fibronectin type III domain-containing protein [Gammaproteobacteria bacterium]|jgi:hypothetical protein|nr:fibronectin type III domain-containing protein [Gammaproteobacteria bacterium]
MADARRTLIVAAVVAVVMAGLAGGGWLLLHKPPAASALAPTLPGRARTSGPGTASITWSKAEPQAAAAGSQDDPVAGFRVYVGPAPGELQLEATIPDPAATRYVVKQLPRGTWYFSVTTYTQLGIESEQPPPIAKTIH